MKHLYLILSCLAALCPVASAQHQAGYYDRMDGKNTADLKAAAKECVKNHTELDYSDLPNYWVYTDVYPDPVDGCRRWWDMYSNTVYLIQPGQTGLESFRANKMEREHSVPKSWWKDPDQKKDVEYTPAYTDLWNLYPSDGTANRNKSNFPLGIVGENPSFDNGVTKVGEPAEGYGDGADKVFEPADEYKGDFARSYLYMATVYDDINWNIATNRGYPCNTMIEKNPYPTFTEWSIEMLLEWCRKDPVSRKELDRNNAVEERQGNRNPFIDFPELAEYIWGSRTAETFWLSSQKNPYLPSGIGPDLFAPDDSEPYILLTRGGFKVCTFSAVRSLYVYGTGGETVMAVREVNDGDTFSLPAGIYIVRIGNGKASKVVIK